jgi:hypothetical protein
VTTVDAEPPLLRVVRGEPTAEELAALLAVVTARAAAAPEVARPRSAWADPARQLHRPVPHGAGGWRRSALPR